MKLRNFIEKSIKICLVSSIAVTPLVFCLLTYDTFELNKLTFFRTFVLLALWLWTIKILLENKIKFKYSIFHLLYFMYFLAISVSCFFSKIPVLAFNFLQDFIYCFIFFMILLNFLNNEDFDIFNFILIFAAVLISIYAIFQHFGVDFILWEPRELVTTRSIGTMGNPIFLAFFLTMVFPINFYLALSRPRYKIFGYAASLLMILALASTYSRGGFLAFLIAFMVFVALLGKDIYLYKKELFLFSLSVFFLFLVFGNVPDKNNLVRGNYEGISRAAKGGDLNLQTRLYLWRSASSIMATHPFFGCGGGSFSYYYLQYRDKEPMPLRGRFALPYYVHNDILQVGAEYGIPALLILLTMILMWFFIICRALFKADGLNPRLKFTGVLSAGLAYLLNSVFSFATVDNKILWFYILTSSIILTGFYREKDINFKKSGKFFKGFVFLLITIFIAVILNFQYKLWVAGYYFKRAKIQQAGKEWEKSYICYNSVLKANPISENYHSQKGKMLEAVLQEVKLGGKLRKDIELEVIRSYSEASELNPLNPYHQADFARFMYIKGKTSHINYFLKESLKKYTEAVMLDPYNSLFINDLALVYLNLKNYQAAEKFLKESLEIYPGNGSAIFNLGILYFQVGDYERALEYFKRALVFEEDKEKINFYINEILKYSPYAEKHR